MTARKVMLLGEIGVGKTSLIRRMVLGRFEQDYKPTFGVDLYRVPILDAGPGRDQEVELVVWDTDGNFGESIFRHVYIKGASGALIIGDLARRPTLDTMLTLAEGFRDALPGRQMVLVANKSDLVPEGEDNDVPQAMKDPRLPLVRTSAKSGSHVQDAFTHIASAILRREC